MEILEARNDKRAITNDEWSRLRYLQDRMADGKLNMTLLSDEISDAFLMLFREIARLNRLSMHEYLEGFNKGFSEGYDQCYADFAYKIQAE